MSGIERFYVDAVDRVRPVMGTDRYGNPTPDWAAGARAPVAGWFTQTTTTETVGGRDAITTGWEFTCGPDADIEASDRLELAGAAYRIMGDIQQAKRPSGVHHLVLKLEKVEG